MAVLLLVGSPSGSRPESMLTQDARPA